MVAETLILAAEIQPFLGFMISGRAIPLLFAAMYFVFVFVMITRSRAGMPVPELRKLPGIDAIDEAIGRATEMGRPICFQPGQADLRNPQTIASFPVLAYVSLLCARYDVRIIQVHRDPPVMSVSEEITHVAYLEAGKPDAFNPDDVRPAMGATMTVQSAIMGIMERERPGAQILWGAFWAEAMGLIEAAAIVGAIQIGATANTAQLPFMVAGCDYTLIGEEMYAASAYLSKDPVLGGTIIGQDMAKVVVVVTVVAGILLSTVLGTQQHFLFHLLDK